MKKTLVILLTLVTTISFSQNVKPIKITELANTIKNSKGPMIVNFWATYCGPCLEEIPYFQELAKQYQSKGLSLVLVSLDLKEAYPFKIDTIARKLNLKPPFLWLNETDADYFCPKVDKSWSGSLPSSLFINNATGYRKFFEDKLSREKLEKEIQALLSTKAN